MGHNLVLYNAELNETMGRVYYTQFLAIFEQFEFSNNAIRIRILYSYSNIRIFDYSPTYVH